MEIRSGIIEDLEGLVEIDATVESSQYLHLECTGEGLAMQWRLELRPFREKLIESNPLDDDRRFALRQVLLGAEDGIVLVAIHDDVPAAVLLAQPDHAAGTMRLLDVRVDYDVRRQGLATAMVFQLIQQARELGLRAVAVETRANNLPANQLFSKCGFQLSGIDVRRTSNQDLVKESATLFWYAELT